MGESVTERVLREDKRNTIGLTMSDTDMVNFSLVKKYGQKYFFSLSIFQPDSLLNSKYKRCQKGFLLVKATESSQALEEE